MVPTRLLRFRAHTVFLARVAWPGAAVGAVLATLLLVAAMARELHSGLGLAVDVVAAVLATAFLLALVGVGVIAVRRLLDAWPRLFTAAMIGPFAAVLIVLTVFDAEGRVGLVVAGAMTLASAALGGVVALIARSPSGMSHGRRVACRVLFAVIVAGCLAAGAWVATPGTDPHVALRPPWPGAAVPPLGVEDPAQKGRYRVGFLTYGSGTDRRRPEYRDRVSLRTEPVDASPLLRNLGGTKAALRRWYWGFGPERLPLNGRVWYPDDAGPFPLVVVVHGNHPMEDYSDGGYAYLGETLASRGFVVVSIDENFLNRSWSGDLTGELSARAYLLLEHLAVWRRWNRTPGHRFHARVDLERIALVGHSRGGETVALAAAFNRLPCLPEDCSVAFDYRFSIQALVAFAPIDGDYGPANQPVPIEDVSYLVLHGSHDGDVATFEGLRAFKRAAFTDGRDRFKAAVYVYRANHAQFNTRWGIDDIGPPFGSLALQKSLLSGEEQRRVAQVFVGGFLEATLKGRREYRTMFRDARTAAGWLPKTTYITQVEDASFRALSDFTRGIDLTRGTLGGSVLSGEHLTVWRQGDVRARMGRPFRVTAVYLGWGAAPGRPTARYRIELPGAAAADWRLDASSRLVFMVADADENPEPRTEPLDFTVEITTRNGVVSRVPLSRIAPVPPIPRVRFTKWRCLDRAFYRRESEPVFQTYELPLSLFAAPGFEPARIREIALVFDRTRSGVILLNEIGFSAGPDAPRRGATPSGS
jgi:dienelactone hydrolase